MSLAQKLLDAIVEHVEDREVLKACALAGSALLASSQSCLFSTVCLVTKTSQIPVYPDAQAFTSFQRFLALLASSPHLGSYVKGLSLHLTIGRNYAAELGREWAPGEAYAEVIGILATTRNISRLEILSAEIPFPWRELPPDLTSQLRRICTRPDFPSLALNNIRDVPSSLVNYAASFYRELFITGSGIRDDTASSGDRFIMGSEDTTQPSSIEDFQLTFWTGKGRDAHIDIVATGLHRRLNRLRKLTLSNFRNQEVHLRRFMFESTFNVCLEDLTLVLSDGAPVNDVAHYTVV
ncbi:hypothetical protein C8R43DRAFT_948155 [Mycena crocata]|nr:hypothetical protein C8R43DRAFT_948155 [Mycena crocata]